MKNADILIIGAGAAGMMAAYTLSKAGKKVIVLEARDRVGGRIHTAGGGAFSKPVEFGAEFIHGNLPVTLQILKEARIECTAAEGEFWQYHQGKFIKEYQLIGGWDKLMKKLSKLKQDISIGEFLELEFGDEEYSPLRESVNKFVAGYDTADPFRASAFALRAEWQAEDDNAQYRVEGGYGKMINYLEHESRKNRVELLLNTVVKDIYIEKRSVKAVSDDGTTYRAGKAVIALPLGVLHADNKTESKVTFYPPLPGYQSAVSQIGFGAIVKLLLEFRDAFWENESATGLTGAGLNKMSFLLSDEEIPTWWTQYPNNSTLLTGWLGGLPAEKKKRSSNEEFLQKALQSLGNIFKIGESELKTNLVAWKVVNWTTDPYTLGSYVYDTVESRDARKILAEPIEDSVYFAGEYLYEGPVMGTVEAALTSGLEAAKKLIKLNG